MKKTSKFYLAIALSLMGFPAFAGPNNTFKNQINDFLGDYMFPICAGMILLGVVVGVIRNFDSLNDANSAGKRKEGLVNLGFLMLYVVVGVAIIALVLNQISKMSFKI
ncbi:MAG: hypothetical protein E6Q85_00420 [Thiothrix sp.]|nr:MAG: hypothetical protein E6Q85_00420 [Thiothrix sp.]